MLNRLTTRLQVLFYYFFAHIIPFIPSFRGKQFDIIIIRTDGIGDFVMWAGAIGAIKDHYSGRKITFVCPSNYVSLVHYLDIFDEVITVDKNLLEKNIWYLCKVLFVFRRYRAKIVINPVRSRICPLDYLVRVIKAKEKLGIQTNRKKFFHHDNYYTSLCHIPEGLHEMEATEVFMRKYITPSYIHGLADFTKLDDANGFSFAKPYCLIAVSSTDERKIWELEKVCEVINNIPKKFAVALTGYGRGDEQRADYIKNHTKSGAKILDYVNKTTIIELVKLVAGSSFVLGNDSSTVHIAAACRVPSICYMTGATYDEFLPYPQSMANQFYHPRVVVKKKDCFGCWYRCSKPYDGTGPLQCLKEVTAPMVIKELNYLLAQIEKQSN